MRASLYPARGVLAGKPAPTVFVPFDEERLTERLKFNLMLQHLRHKRAPIGRWLLTLLGVLWLGLVVQTCAMAEIQADGTGDCCCEESSTGCDWGYTPLGEAPCPAMQAGSSDRQPQGLTAGERPSADPAPLPSRVVYPPADIGFTSPRLARADAPHSHPALRFRVLLI